MKEVQQNLFMATVCLVNALPKTSRENLQKFVICVIELQL